LCHSVENNKVVPLRRDVLFVTFDLADVDHFAEACCIIAGCIARYGWFLEKIERLKGTTYRACLRFA
jgi:hypothetical protein